VPIVQGPLRGKRWITGSSTHGCWLGTYELDTQQVLAQIVRPGMICYDCGANAGYFTLLMSVLTGPSGKVLAFEPDPSNVRHLDEHLRVNRIENAVVYPIALSNSDGITRFEGNGSMGHISAEGELSVKCRRLDSLQLPPPDVMKIDVEGAEADLLDGADELLRSYRPTLLISMHMPIHLIVDRLALFGYQVAWLSCGGLFECHR
jgi:FkbM family methyltransferase